MNKYRVVATIAIVLQLLLAFSPFLPFVERVFPANPTARQTLSLMLTFMGLHAVVFTSMVAILVGMDSDDHKKGVDRIIDRLRRAPTKRLREDDFYAVFGNAISSATSRVFISYFAPYPPQKIPDARVSEYYDYVAKLPYRNKRVQFHRLIRETPENLAWANALLEKWEGKANASIALLSDSASDEMGLSMSVQVVDSQKSWLVAIASHTRIDEHRDFEIDDEVLTEAIADYYLKLWSKSTVILDHGRRTNAPTRKIEAQPKLIDADKEKESDEH